MTVSVDVNLSVHLQCKLNVIHSFLHACEVRSLSHVESGIRGKKRLLLLSIV